MELSATRNIPGEVARSLLGRVHCVSRVALPPPSPATSIAPRLPFVSAPMSHSWVSSQTANPHDGVPVAAISGWNWPDCGWGRLDGAPWVLGEQVRCPLLRTCVNGVNQVPGENPLASH